MKRSQQGPGAMLGLFLASWTLMQVSKT